MIPTSVSGEKQISISGGSRSPSDIAFGRTAEVRRRNMSYRCILENFREARVPEKAEFQKGERV